MSRNFVGTSSQYLLRNSAIISGVPFTMACWVRVSSVTTSQAFMSINTTAASDRHVLSINTTGTIQANTTVSSVDHASISTGTVSANTWTHCAGVWSANNNRVSYLNGTASPANLDNFTPVSLTTTMLGARRATTLGSYLTGQLTECCIWSVALDADEITSLAKGQRAFQIRPDAILAYWPLGGHFGEVDADFSGGGHLLTANGSPTWSEFYPPIISTPPIYFLTATNQTISLDSIASTTAVNGPTITPGSVAISLPAIDATTTVQQPTIAPGAVNISSPLIAATTVVQQPVITPGAVSVSLPVVAATTVVQQPSIAAKYNLALDVIDATTTVNGPTLTPGAVSISAPLIAANTTVYQPVINVGGLSINFETIGPNTTVYEPTLTPGPVSVALDIIGATTTVQQPTVAAGTITVAVDTIAPTTQVYQPDVYNTLQQLNLPVIAPTTQVYGPVVGTISNDTSDILKRRKRTRKEIEEENIAVQLLTKQRAETLEEPGSRKQIKIDLKTQQNKDHIGDASKVIPMSDNQFAEVGKMVEAYKLQQIRNKRIRTLLLLASMED